MVNHHLCEKHRKQQKKHSRKRKTSHIHDSNRLNSTKKPHDHGKSSGKNKKCKHHKKHRCVKEELNPIMISSLTVSEHSVSQEVTVEIPSPAYSKHQAQDYILHQSPKSYSRPCDLDNQKISAIWRQSNTSLATAKYPRPAGSRSSVSNYSYANFKYDSIDFKKYFETAKEWFSYVYERPPLLYSIVTFIVCWWILSMIDSWYSEIMLTLVTYGRSAGRCAVIWLEQSAKMVLRWSTNAEELIESFYCDFAASWCKRFEMLCDVNCSFMEKSLQRIRSQP